MTALRVGAEPGEARAAVVLVHGRGSDPEDMLGLAGTLERQMRVDGTDIEALAWVALRAPGGSWYPYGFMEPIDRNQPELDRSLSAIGDAVQDLVTEGVALDRIGLMGFSQGACLSQEHAARNPGRFGAIVGLSGGLIGPPGTPRSYDGSLEGTPVFLGCSDIDPHIPESRVRESAEVLAAMEGAVTLRIYPGMGHTVNEDEIDAVVSMIQEML